MNVRLIRFVAGLAATAMVSVLGAGMANASTADRVESRIESAAASQTTHTAGEYLQQLHDYLAAAVTSDDVAAVQAAVAQLRPVLGVVAEAPAERAALVLTDRVDAEAAQVERDLPGLTLLAPITGLLTSLLTTLLDLVTSLLGGLPVPLPVPLPELPVPLPEVPGVPLPEVPEVPAPGGEPPVDAPLPEVPLPDAPLPDAPLPDAPVPDAPLPAVP
ncbi:MAG: hypothetical protein GEV28_34905 [Actinophytocola sp.]|uniref:hypothetical protein n=1 Tax=Actinophytocola sp. TaxID=1872138 RepID=UPI001326A29A|nr:hypothetical protein [Actinophytocola sp.]MPZ85299.1 hypothetical protein [Actinophytocola sp.]